MSILSGIKIVEIEGIGPAPFCGMQLADFGAEVILIQRPGNDAQPIEDGGDASVLKRGKKIIELDLKNPEDCAQALKLISLADGLIEGMRPGVMERLGLGPEICLKANPKLAYGRVTGWGQSGPLAHAAGHDINYIGLSSALWYAGKPGDPPFAPPTLVGDVGGGALHLAIGMLAAILNAHRTGKGDTIDAAMVDGSANMMNLALSLRPSGMLNNERGKSILDGPHWFDSYLCSDDKFITVGSLEAKFYQILLEKLGLADDPVFKDQFDQSQWPEQKRALTEIFKSQTQTYWCEQLEGSDACFAPVLTPDEAAEHPHMQARDVFVTRNDNLEANPAPRFSEFAANKPVNAARTNIEDLLNDWSEH